MNIFGLCAKYNAQNLQTDGERVSCHCFPRFLALSTLVAFRVFVPASEERFGFDLPPLGELATITGAATSTAGIWLTVKQWSPPADLWQSSVCWTTTSPCCFKLAHGCGISRVLALVGRGVLRFFKIRFDFEGARERFDVFVTGNVEGSKGDEAEETLIGLD
jgi:hypothetical protein